MQHICGYCSFPTIIANGIPFIPMGYDNRKSLGLPVKLIICDLSTSITITANAFSHLRLSYLRFWWWILPPHLIVYTLHRRYICRTRTTATRPTRTWLTRTWRCTCAPSPSPLQCTGASHLLQRQLFSGTTALLPVIGNPSHTQAHTHGVNSRLCVFRGF